jgi:hypothetical protein
MRAKTKDLSEADDNTQYFHLVANGNYKKTTRLQTRTRMWRYSG